MSDLPPLKTQVEQWWKALAPGEFVELTGPREQMSYDESSASSIEFWGQYVPPKISPEEGKTLNEAGIDFPRTELESVHVRFEAKR